MPKDPQIRRVLIVGSGPIIIGQACEFDYSGTQACKALREEGIGVVLLNSNPATIMTDPDVADRTYIEPITPDLIGKVLARERANGTPVDSILPTLGGQTGLNCAVEAEERGILAEHNVRMIGADRDAIHRAEDRTAFKHTMESIGMDLPRSGVAHSMREAQTILEEVGLPCCIRPAYTLGGAGGGFVHTLEEFRQIARSGLEQSRVSAILIEESLYGWKEFELEVMRDRRDNVVIICSIENLDPMGVHTGDSITVAPAMTLSDREYQTMRDDAIAIIRAIGVETGGSNIQFAVHPQTGRRVVIEMNPRVSRSSALASKATGFPIAKVATKLAVGYTLDEIPNDITKETLACFEPTLDYVVLKMPRWAFEKFPDAVETLTTQMKSVGEAMAIGRTFKEALQKCIRSMEIKRFGLGLDGNDRWLNWHRARHSRVPEPAAYVWVDDAGMETNGGVYFGGTNLGEAPGDWKEESASEWPVPDDVLHDKLGTPCQGRLYYIRYALKLGWSVEKIHEVTGIDPWFLTQIQDLVQFEDELAAAAPGSGPARVDAHMHELYRRAKSLGYSDIQLCNLWRLGANSPALAELRRNRLVYKLVDTCAAEFEAYTPYYYSTHESPVTTIIRSPEAVASLKTPARVAEAAEAGGNGRTQVRSLIESRNIRPPYGYRPLDSEHLSVSWYDDEIRVSEKQKVIIIGGGPNRIGQGIEFDYCCVHAAMAAREMGYEAVMINSNPETVSTDFDTSDLLFFEPLTHEDVFNVCERLNGRPFTAGGPEGLVKGVIVQFGGQTPLNLAEGLAARGVPIIGTSPRSIHLAEEREHFRKILHELGLMQPASDMANSVEDALRVAEELGYPVIVRPSYVLGGRAMEICNNPADLRQYADRAWAASDRDELDGARNPILIDKFLLDAVEVDVDAVSDHGQPGKPTSVRRCDICGIMEHIEEAGVHSGDSCCTLPPYSMSPSLEDEITHQVKLLARHLNVCGLMNVQFAIHERAVYVLEVNPRASRTVPFVSKATGVPWASIATKVMLGLSLNQALAESGIHAVWDPNHVSVKVPVFPFNKFRGVDAVLGPEMKSTGEVMGMDRSYPIAFAKAMLAAGIRLPTAGTVLVSTNDPDKPRVVSIARELHEMGFELVATIGTHQALKEGGVPSKIVSKHAGDEYPFLLEMIHRRELAMLINTPIHKGAAWEEGRWRAACIQENIPLITTLAGARAAVGAIGALRKGEWSVAAVQDYMGRGRPV